MKNALPLRGVKVIELTHMVMGPAAGVILADLGADVIKLEPIGGDPTRQLKGSGAGYFPMYNRNKRSLSVNLKSEDGLKLARELIRGADIFIENFRGGAVERLGLGYDTFREENPGLIFCSEKGFLSGPYDHRTALDEVAQMMGGLAYMTGPPGRPLRAGSSVIDIAGGMFGVIGILAALAERSATGRGRKVVSSLFETTAFMVGQHIAQAAVTGETVKPMPVRTSAWAIYDLFDTMDDKQLFIGVVSDKQWPIFCNAFSLHGFRDDPGLQTNAQRVEARDRILPAIRSICKSHSQDELVSILEESGLPFAPVAHPEDLTDNPHLNANGGLLNIELPDQDGSAKLPSLPLEIDETRTSLRYDPPKAGEHTLEILSELGCDAARIKRLIDQQVVDPLDE
jgi:crotonobetainyl-CoA:carnitine CoA-transferase CaiB-like acyl-CoA transferase